MAVDVEQASTTTSTLGELRAWLGRPDRRRALKRSLRGALVVPSVFAFALQVLGNPQTVIFATFGSFALMFMVEFSGPPRRRIRSYLTLFAVGLVFIPIGTLCSRNDALAFLSMAVAAFVVLFAGVLSAPAASGAVAALLLFVLPVAIDGGAGDIGPRMLGWCIAAAVCIPAVLVIWPLPWRSDFRVALAASARTLAATARAAAAGAVDEETAEATRRSVVELRRRYESTPYRPTGAALGDLTLAKLVGRLEWVSANLLPTGGVAGAALAYDEVRSAYGVVADVLDLSGRLIAEDTAQAGEAPAELLASLDRLNRARAAMAEAILGRLTAGVELPSTEDLEESTMPVLGLIDSTHHVRSLVGATEMVARTALEASPATSDAQFPGGVGARADQARIELRNAGRLVRAHLTLDSVWLRNSLRGALALGLAVLVTKFTGVGHAFWVVLGTLSVLRTNATATGTTALVAVGGTVAGFIAGSVILLGIGKNSDLLWAVLPVAVFLAGYLPVVASFGAGQAAFTMTVVILFNLIQPTGWQVGLVRVEDIAIGCAVSVVVGLLFWPRGASNQLARSLGEAYRTAADYVVGIAVQLRTPDPSAVALSRSHASDAYQRMDEAFRQFLAERGEKRIPLDVATDLVTGVLRVTLAGDSLAGMTPVRWAQTGELPAPIMAADAQLRVAFDLLRRWFDDFAEAAAGHRDVPPVPEPDHRHLDAGLVEGVGAARQLGGVAPVQFMLRLLWAEQNLIRLEVLQVELAGIATRSGAQRRLSWRRDRPSATRGGQGVSK